MAFFLIGRGADDALQLLSANPFESRQDAMAELSRITSDPTFSQWDLEVFVVDLDAGVPVLLVRPQREQADGNVAVDGNEEAEPSRAAESEEAEGAVAPEPEVESTPPTLGDIAEETRGNLREALQRTAEQMSSEGIVPPPSAGLEPQDVPQGSDEEAIVDEATDASEAAEDLNAEEQSWPWDAPATPPAPEPGVSPEIATVYEGLEQMEAQESGEESHAPVSEGTPLQAEGSDFILDLEAIQPVAMEPQGTDAAGPPAKPEEAPTDEAPEVPSEPAEQTAETPPGDEEAPAGQLEESPVQETEFPSSMTEYTCEDCVYVETCPNRDQREPKDCGSFQWK